MGPTLIEPSNTEQAEWPDATRDYVHGLEEALLAAQANHDSIAEAERNRIVAMLHDMARESLNGHVLAGAAQIIATRHETKKDCNHDRVS